MKISLVTLNWLNVSSAIKKLNKHATYSICKLYMKFKIQHTKHKGKPISVLIIGLKWPLLKNTPLNEQRNFIIVEAM